MTLETLYPLVLGPVVAGLVETAKRVPVIPFEGRTRAAIVSALVLVSLVLRVALAWATGQLATFAWDAELRLALEAIIAALVAAGGYSLLRK